MLAKEGLQHQSTMFRKGAIMSFYFEHLSLTSSGFIFLLWLVLVYTGNSVAGSWLMSPFVSRSCLFLSILCSVHLLYNTPPNQKKHMHVTNISILQVDFTAMFNMNHLLWQEKSQHACYPNKFTELTKHSTWEVESCNNTYYSKRIPHLWYTKQLTTIIIKSHNHTSYVIKH